MNADSLDTLKTRLIMLEQDFIATNDVTARLRASGASPKTINSHLMTLAGIAEDMDKVSSAIRVLMNPGA